MTKKLQLTKEIADLGDDYHAAIKCRDECIRSVFKTKKAIFYQKQATKILKKFWSLIYELYPQTQFEDWTYNYEDQCLHYGKNDEETD